MHAVQIELRGSDENYARGVLLFRACSSGSLPEKAQPKRRVTEKKRDTRELPLEVFRPITVSDGPGPPIPMQILVTTNSIAIHSSADQSATGLFLAWLGRRPISLSRTPVEFQGRLFLVRHVLLPL